MSEQSKEDRDKIIDDALEKLQAEQAAALKNSLVIAQVSKWRFTVLLVMTTDFCAGHVFRAKQVFGPKTKEQCQQFCCDVNNGVVTKESLREFRF